MQNYYSSNNPHSLPGRTQCYGLNFTEEETEVQSGLGTCSNPRGALYLLSLPLPRWPTPSSLMEWSLQVDVGGSAETPSRVLLRPRGRQFLPLAPREAAASALGCEHLWWRAEWLMNQRTVGGSSREVE